MVDLSTFLQKFQKDVLRFETKTSSNGVPPEFWETYSAFANTFGGTIIFGLTEDESQNLHVTGVTNPNTTIESLWDGLNNPRFTNYNLLVSKDIYTEEVDGLNVIIVDVPAADRHKRPVYINDNLSAGTFKRNQRGNYHCSIAEIQQMLRESEDKSSDCEPLPELTTACFDTETISRYLRELSIFNPSHIWCHIPLNDFLEVSGATATVDGVAHPTIAGLLMFGKLSSIRRILGNYALEYRESQGVNGWTYRHTSHDGSWSGNIYDFVTEVTNRIQLKIGVPFVLNGFSRSGSSAKLAAVREAVMNALIHADYRLAKGVVIELRPNELKITNPGTMRVKLSDALKGRHSEPRNATLMTFAMAIGWVEHMGSGIYEIEKTARSGDLAYAHMKEYTDPSMVEITLGISDRTSSPRTESILEHMRNNPEASRESIAKDLGISVSTVGKEIARLKKDQRLIRVGAKKNGYWKVL